MIQSWHDWLVIVGWILIVAGIDVGALWLLWAIYRHTPEEHR